MIITVTRIVIKGEISIEETATAQLDRVGISEALRDLNDSAGAERRHHARVTEVSRALFESLDPES
jgi:hypothetical protein